MKEKSKNDKPTESKYAKTQRAKRAYLKRGGNIDQWRELRRTGRIKI